jgi:hypothetical protein
MINYIKEIGAYYEEFAGEAYWVIDYANDDEL